MFKYPRTRHIQGSRLQPGDEDLESVPFESLRGKYLVIEEKLDGSNCGISFAGGRLHLQSRGHYLVGGPREQQFDQLKAWANCQRDPLELILEDRYVLFGEWLYAKHTVFYDRLPHYLMEFDLLDTRTGEFLSTPRRRQLLADLPIRPVPVLTAGVFADLEELAGWIGRSLYKSSGWGAVFESACTHNGVDISTAWAQTDPSDRAEGLYIKHEDEDRVIGRYKIVRQDFTSQILQASSHWMSRPIIPNGLAPGVDIFAC